MACIIMQLAPMKNHLATSASLPASDCKRTDADGNYNTADGVCCCAPGWNCDDDMVHRAHLEHIKAWLDAWDAKVKAYVS